MRLRNVWVGALGLALATSVAACGGGSGNVEYVGEPVRRRRRSAGRARKSTPRPRAT